MEWSELAASLQPAPGSGLAPDTEVRGMAYDSRQLEPGFLFVAIAGQHHDGHEFVARALELGAAGAVVDHLVDQADPLRQVVVPDTQLALGQLAAGFYRRPSLELPVIGVTGTDGKTTTSIMLHAALSEALGNVGCLTTVDFRCGRDTEPNLTRQTTLESLDLQRQLRRMADKRCRAVVLESTSHGLALHRLDEIRFTGSVYTKITHDHLDFHGSWEAYFEAKALLLERALGAGGFAVLDRDDQRAFPLLQSRAGERTLSYSAQADPDADLRAVRVVPTPEGVSFSAQTPDGEAQIQLRMAGRWNVGNALAALAAGLLMGQPLRPLASGLRTLAGVPGRMEAVELGQSFSVIIDYAHTPAALTLALHELRSATPNKLWVVFGSAGERDLAKRPEMGAIAARMADFVVVTSEDPRGEDQEAIVDQICRGAIDEGGRTEQEIVREPDRALAVALAIAGAQPGDTVLLAGKGHEASIIGPDGPTPWSDRSAAEKAIRQRLGW